MKHLCIGSDHPGPVGPAGRTGQPHPRPGRGQRLDPIFSRDVGGNVSALALSPGYPTDRTLFAGTGGGVFKSANGGDSWSAMNKGLESLNILSLALTPTFPRTLFAGTNDGGAWQYTFAMPYRLWLPLVLLQSP